MAKRNHGMIWQMQTPDEGVESPGREIREMLKNHDEPLEEWKD